MQNSVVWFYARVVPIHTEIQTGTLRGILKQAGVDVKTFIEQL